MAAGDLTLLDEYIILNTEFIEQLWSDDDFIYAASNLDGLRTYSVNPTGGLTFIDQDHVANPGAYNGVWGDGTFIYVTIGGGSAGLQSYSVNPTGGLTDLDFISDLGGAGDNYLGVWGDGTFLYCACRFGGIRSYSVDLLGNLTFKHQHNIGVVPYYSVWGDGTYIYVTSGDGILSYSANQVTGVLTHIDTDKPSLNEQYLDVWGDGTFIYMAHGANGLYTYSVVPSSGNLTELSLNSIVGGMDSVHGDGTFLYTNPGDLSSWSVDPSGSTTHLAEDDRITGTNTVWTDGTFIYTSSGSTVSTLRSYEVEPSSSSSSSSLSSSSSSSVSSSSSSVSSSSSSSSLSSSSSVSSSSSSSSLSSSSNSSSSSSNSSSSSSSSTSLALPSLKHFWYTLRDNQGVPRGGELVNVYESGTTNPLSLYNQVGLPISNPVTTLTDAPTAALGVFEFYLKDEMWNNVSPSADNIGYEWDDRIKLVWDNEGDEKSADRIMTWGDFHPIYDVPFDPHDWSQITDPTGEPDANDKNKAISNSLAYQIECHIAKELEDDLESSSSRSSSSSSSTSSSSTSSSSTSSSSSNSSSSSVSSSSSSESVPLATIGNTGIGSNISGQSAGAAAAILVQFPSNSDVYFLHAYGDFGWNGGGEGVKGVIWDSSGDVVAVTPETTGTETASWHIMTFSSPVAVSGSVNYYIGTVEEQDDVYIESNAGNTYNGYLDDSNSFASPESIGSPAGSEKLAIYATYEAV